MSRDLDKKVSQKKFILSTFKKEIMDFMKFIIKILPDFHELKTLKNILDLMCKFNTVKLLNIWCTYIALPYKDLIIKGDFNYFENKNYKNDVVDLGEEQANYILQTYDKMRTKISKVSKDDKNKAMKFIQRLSAMSVKYYN
tara:strand:+ start:747 stop:1169 length:423 start_codon:yes stop_codon:yes gene_type:complete